MSLWRHFCSRMSNIHELCRQSNGDESLTHSNLLNLFIKLELSNFHLPPLQVLCLSKSVQSSWGRFDEGRLERHTFSWRAWERVCRALQRLKSAIMEFMWFCFVNMLFFWLSAFAHISMKAGRGIYDRDDVSFTIARRRPQFIRWIILKLKSFYDFFKICN